MFTIHELKLTDDIFDTICRANPDLNFEQTAAGELVVVPPTGGTSGRKNLSLSTQFGNWVEQNPHLGEGFDSSTLFVLPNGAKRSPDASWVRRDRWDALSQKQQDGYVPLCPDFVVELRSPTDSLKDLQAKMQEYMDNGARLGWLINPQEQTSLIYRQGQEVAVLREAELSSRESPTSLSGEEVLPGFMLRLDPIWR
jgi:Uma2 family endonuclease